MIKNFKKTFVSILALVFSTCCVVNWATLAASWWPANPNYEYFSSEFPCGQYDYEGQPFDSSFAKNRKFDELRYEESQEYYPHKDLDWSKVPFSSGLYNLCLSVPKELSEYPPLYDILAQYVFLIQNYISSVDDYKMVMSNLNVGKLENLFNVSLKLTPDQKATILSALIEIARDENPDFDYYSFFDSKRSLNLFDVMFVYRYVCNIDKEDYYGWKELIANILREKGIDPKIVVPETFIPDPYF